MAPSGQLLENAGLHTYTVQGGDIAQLRVALESLAGIEQVAPFGDTLHVTGTDRSALQAAIAPFRDRGGASLGRGRDHAGRCLHPPDGQAAPRGRPCMIERPPLFARLLNHLRGLSARRINAVLIKEFIQLRRDRVTFGMILGVPLLELVLFGFAINNDPKQLPTAIFVQDHSAYSRAVVECIRELGLFPHRVGQ